jgi:hypothetical protein
MLAGEYFYVYDFVGMGNWLSLAIQVRYEQWTWLLIEVPGYFGIPKL